MAQLVEQLTRNEQVACSNQVSSSKMKSPKSGLTAGFSGILLYRETGWTEKKCALITLAFL